MRNSERSLLKPRIAIAATSLDDEKLKVPNKGLRPLKGDSLKKPAICCLAGMEKLPSPKFVPFESVKKKLINTGWLLGLTIAIPVLTAPPTSAKIRPDEINGEIGTDVSETRVPRERNPKMARPDGRLLPLAA